MSTAKKKTARAGGGQQGLPCAAIPTRPAPLSQEDLTVVLDYTEAAIRLLRTHPRQQVAFELTALKERLRCL